MTSRTEHSAANTYRVDREQVRAELSARRARQWELARFVREAWQVLEPTTPLVWGRHLDAMCEHLEAVADGRIRRLVINVPPGHMKSLLVRVFFPAWWWLREPSKRFVGTTYDDKLTVRDSMRLRDVVTSEWYRETFRPDWELRKDQKAKAQFNTTKTGYCTSTSVKGSTTGKRGDVILIDDPLDVSGANSAADRAVANAYMRQTLPTRVNDPRTGVFILIMQRLHIEDPSAHAIQSGWVHLCLPSEYEPERHCFTSIGWEDWRSEPGELLFPEMYTREVIDRMKVEDLGSDAFAGQHQQRPIPPEGKIIRGTWMQQRYERLPIECELHGVWEQSWDVKAGSKDPRSSWVVGQVWCRIGSVRYLVDQVRGRWDIEETMREIENLSARYPRAVRKIIEAKADGRAIVTMLKAKVEGLVLHNPGTADKGARLRATRPLWEAGNIWLPEELPSATTNNTMALYVEEMTSVPVHPFDDQADATSQYLNETIALARERGAPAAPPRQHVGGQRSSLARLGRLAKRSR